MNAQINLQVAVGQVTLYFRHSRSLKDKRQGLRSLEQKLRNQGFSVTECGYSEDPKRAVLGFAFVGHDAAHADRVLEEAFRLFVGEWEVVDSDRDLFDYSEWKEGDQFARFADED